MNSTQKMNYTSVRITRPKEGQKKNSRFVHILHFRRAGLHDKNKTEPVMLKAEKDLLQQPFHEAI